MRVLLDTHVFIRWVDGAAQLTEQQIEVISTPGNEVYLSIVSVWEMAIKSSLDKLRLAIPLAGYVKQNLAANRFQLLPVELSHVVEVAALPWHHRDPFDRLLIAQAIIESLTVITRDLMLARYAVPVL